MLLLYIVPLLYYYEFFKIEGLREWKGSKLFVGKSDFLNLQKCKYSIMQTTKDWNVILLNNPCEIGYQGLYGIFSTRGAVCFKLGTLNIK